MIGSESHSPDPNDYTREQWRRWYIIVLVMHLLAVALMFLFTVTFHP